MKPHKLPSKQDIDAHVGKRLRLRRTMMGLSQESVAKAIGVTFQQVQKYEKGSNAMNASRLVEFARFMNVPVSYFFEGLDEFSANTSQVGFGEDNAVAFEHKTVSDRESLEMMKAFKRIKEQVVRKRLADMVRAIADSKPILE
ncbi:MAG: helix-turn-helix transcriptional regulator [Rickettsiales bacterium]|nr:helix-turn-helix transcriptional regulator [Rickettsiales bacterium]